MTYPLRYERHEREQGPPRSVGGIRITRLCPSPHAKCRLAADETAVSKSSATRHPSDDLAAWFLVVELFLFFSAPQRLRRR
jgi:hypothetical protein